MPPQLSSSAKATNLPPSSAARWLCRKRICESPMIDTLLLSRSAHISSWPTCPHSAAQPVLGAALLLPGQDQAYLK